MKIRNIRELTNIQGKKVIIRVDYNVPTNKDGEITDLSRIKDSLKTIKTLIEKEAKIIIICHFGRPKGKVIENLRVDKIKIALEKLLNKKIEKTDEIYSKNVIEKVNLLKNSEILMLENLRFDPREEKNNINFAKQLASLADIYINEAFAVCHRKHSSTVALAKLLPAYAGYSLINEIENLNKIRNQEPARPITFIFGGSKIETKLSMIMQFIEKSDYVLTGGALANTFLKAAGYNIADSLYEENQIQTAQETMLEYEKHHEKFILPIDAIVCSEIKEDAETLNIPIQDIEGDMKIVDIGEKTIEKYKNIILKSATIIFNGPMGIYEIKNFQQGTKAILETIAAHNCDSFIGGGDSTDALNMLKIDLKNFTHVSMGGGALIKYLEGKDLEAIKALSAK